MSVDLTDRRAPIRVLLRGIPLVAGMGLARVIGGRRVMLMSVARAADWAGVEVRKGDVEGLTWAKAARANEVMAALRACPEVVETRIAPQDVAP